MPARINGKRLFVNKFIKVTDQEIDAENRRNRNVVNPKTGADAVNFSILMTLAYEQAALDFPLTKLSDRYDNLEFIFGNILEKVPVKNSYEVF